MSMLTAIVIALVVATLFVLGAGIYSMAHGGPEDEAKANSWMTRRVVIQGAAIFFVLIAMLSQLK